MNIYRYKFTSECPANKKQINFRLEILTKKMIMVEDIKAFCAKQVKAYHEPIADALFNEFGGYQVLVAWHHGVEIETRRGTPL